MVPLPALGGRRLPEGGECRSRMHAAQGPVRFAGPLAQDGAAPASVALAGEELVEFMQDGDAPAGVGREDFKQDKTVHEGLFLPDEFIFGDPRRRLARSLPGRLGGRGAACYQQD